GHVKVDGRTIDDVPTYQRNIGFLFQNYALFPHMSVEENIAFPLRARKISGEQRKRMVDAALELVQLPDTHNRSIRSLSGGQQQRIALARALVFEPSLLLLDEPLAALDKQLREAMQLELKRIQSETGTTTIAVTHDQVEAMSMSDLVAIMNKGRLVQVGTPEEVYARPSDLFVSTFLGEANLIDVDAGAFVGWPAPVKTSAADGVAVVRPEDIELTPATDGLIDGRVESSVFQGNRRRLTVRCPGLPQPLIVSGASGADAAYGVDAAVGVRLRRNEVHVIPREAADASEVFVEAEVAS
ncbi:MAG TPA: ABC transporter ATP-binding protein, partial [Nocardioidaceae bacterium]